jgi:hypothetical protein
LAGETEAKEELTLWWKAPEIFLTYPDVRNSATRERFQQCLSQLFGADAAWRRIMILAFNESSTMKGLVLGDNWVSRRMKAIHGELLTEEKRRPKERGLT